MNKELRESFENFLAAFESDPLLVEYRDAKNAYENDRALGVKVNEYNVQSSLLDQESNKAEKDTLLIESIKARMEELYSDISANPVMERMSAAEDKLTYMFAEINEGLQLVVNPDAADGCGGGGCSSCSGCGH